MPGTTFYNQHAVAASNPGFSDIKCNRCGAVKKVTAFAKNQLKYLETKKKAPTFNADTTAVITCIPCSPQQRTELTCHQCDKTKGLDFFPKTQRRDPDHAMCWSCKEERANFEPGAEDSEASSASNDTDSDSDDEFRLDSVVDATESMSLGGSRSGGGATYSSRGTGGVQLDRSTQAGTTTRASSTVGTSVTATPSSGLPAGFNRHAYGTPDKGDPKKFAKVKAGTRHRIIYDVAEQERQQNEEEGDYEVSSDSDSD